MSNSLFINTSIKYLDHSRFKKIYDMLRAGQPSWEICGEKINGVPITDEEIKFVASKTQKEGFIYN